MDESASLGFGLVILAVMLAGYFLPTIVASIRGRDGQNMLFLLNLLLGWTVIGWVIILVLAFTGETASARKQREEQLSLLRQMAANNSSASQV